MIQAWKDLRFSAKLTLIFFLVLSLTIGVITIRQSYSSFRLLEEKSLEDMENLAEQVILNFTQTLEDIENSCYVAMISREVPKNMSGSATYAVQKYTLATMISSATSYDYIMTRNSQRQLISTDFRNDMPTEQRSQIEADCRTILEEHQENTLGSCQWIRMDSGHVYLLRDVYDTQPLRHMGVIVLHIRQPFFAASSASENTGFLFLDKNGDFLTYTGTELPEGMTDEVIADAQAGTLPSKNNWSGGEYFAVSVAGSQWSVIVICSTQSYRTGCRQIMQNGIALGALGLLAGMALVYILTRSVLKKLGEIKKSMKEVANGNFDSRIEVTDADDISQLALAFNDMSQRISELMAELVEKERMRSNAELQVLEYKYRALETQIRPHFIYNALEVISSQMEILFYDHDLAVCVKPVGLDSEAQVPAELKKTLGGEIFPVHRLDKNVGGVMVYARTKQAAAALSKAVQDGAMAKEYVAMVHGLPPESGDWEDLLWKDSRKNKVYVVKRERSGVKKARLEFTRLSAGECSLVRIRLHTGRSHQIRVQFASRGYPLVGDHKYGSRDERTDPMLFSCCIRFPWRGEQRRFEAMPDFGENP